MSTALEQVRKSKKITQEYIANKVGIAISTYCQYENGVRNVPREIAEKVAGILGVSINEIFLPEKFTVSKISS